MLLKKSRETAPERMKRLNQSGDNGQLRKSLVVKEKKIINAVKNNIA